MLIDLFKGFGVTFKHIFRPSITINYGGWFGRVKNEKKPLPAYYRGRHRLQRYANGLERCVGCALCAAVCPSEAIYLEAAENDPNNPTSAGERYARVYTIHHLRCIWCGFCEEACPEDAIVMGTDYELAKLGRHQFVVDKGVMLDPPEKGFGDPEDLKVNMPL